MRHFRFRSLWLIFIFLTIAEIRIFSSESHTTRFAARGEYLYFQPIFTHDFIATPTINGQFPFNLQPGGPGKKNKFDYVSGYRLHALYFTHQRCRLKEISLCLTYLPASHSMQTSLDSFLSQVIPSNGNNVNPEPSIPGVLKANHQLLYYAADLLTTFPIFSSSQFEFSIQPGIHYACMDYHTHVKFSTNGETLFKKGRLKEHSHTWGSGPELGFQLDYSFNNWLMLKSKIKGGLLLSKATASCKHRSSLVEEKATSSFSIHPDKGSWKFFPFWQAQIGINISVPLCCDGYTLEIEIGYEYLTYPNFINRLLFLGHPSSSTNPKSLFSNFDFQGPYAALILKF